MRETAKDLTLELFNDDEEDEIQTWLFDGTPLAYIKAVDLETARAMGVIVPLDIHLPPSAKLYSLHAADGTTLGVTDSWACAYSVAVERNLVPLTVH